MFRENAPKFLLQKNFSANNPCGKRKVWHGDTFTKLVFVTQQRNVKFKIIFLRQNKPVYETSELWGFSPFTGHSRETRPLQYLRLINP